MNMESVIISDEVLEEYATSSIKLSKDLKQAAKNLDEAQVRYLVDRYYQLQKDRIRADHQAKEDATPNNLVTFVRDHAWKLESTIKLAMKHYSLGRVDGQWLMGVHGIGPVLSAGLLAHIDITKARTAGSVWRFAGLDPTVTWEKKSKRPWNARLKTLCWKIGDSFVKQSTNDKCFYGKLYRARKLKEVEKNLSGAHEEAAKDILAKKKFRDDTKAKAAYSEGRLPDGHVDMRARRMVEKLFLSHVFQVMWEVKFKTKAPIPYVFAIEGHDFNHYLSPPDWDGIEE